MGPDCSAVASLSHFFLLPCLLGHEFQKKPRQGGLEGYRSHPSWSPAVPTLPLCCGQEDLALIKMEKQALGLDSAFCPTLVSIGDTHSARPVSFLTFFPSAKSESILHGTS